MDSNEFVLAIEDAWDRELAVKQSQAYLRKLERFSDNQLDQIHDKILEDCKYFPRIADIYSAARDAGCLARPPLASKAHTWDWTDCKLCHGEGRIEVWKRHRRTEMDEGWILRRIFQYSGYDRLEYKPGLGEYSYLYRCSCPAGNLETLPVAWPRWESNGEQIWEERVA